MTYCVVKRNARTYSIADANDPRVGVYVERASNRTFWDYVAACDHGRELAEWAGVDFLASSWINDGPSNKD